MKILEIKSFPNGAHRNQEWDKLPIPDGWAVIPEDMELESFPFGNVTAEEITHYRDVEVMRDVTKTREVETLKEVVKTREVPALDEEGNAILDENGDPVLVTEEYIDFEPVTVTEEYIEQEMVTEQQPYGVMTVTGWEPLPMPEPEPEPGPEPSVWDELDAAYREGVNGV